VSVLRALTHPARLEIFQLLLSHEPDAMTAEVIASHMRSRDTRVSVHLNLLARVGLICASDGRGEQRYRACAHALPDLFSFLSARCCGESPNLCLPTFMASDDWCLPVEDKKS